MQSNEETRSIDLKDFEFVNFKSIDKILKQNAHLKSFHSSPTIDTFDDVIYTPPSKVAPGQYRGCLYDADGHRIKLSCIQRGADECLTVDPIQYAGQREIEVFDAEVLYLGTLFGKYGHFLLESLSRWWPLIEDENRPRYFLFHLHSGSGGILQTPFVKQFLSLFGIKRECVVYFDRPTRVKRIILPEPAFRIRSYFYSRYREIFSFVREAIDLPSEEETDQPLYFSRSLMENRHIKNEGELETLLKDNGVKVIHPQMVPLEEQMRLINRHKYIMGPSGSAMHNVVYSSSPKELIHITAQEVHSNYLLTDKCFGATSTFINGLQSSLEHLSFVKRLLASPISGETLDHVWRAREQRFSLRREAVYAWLKSSGLIS